MAQDSGRAAFEAFQRDGHTDETGDLLLQRRSNGKYVNNNTQSRWVYWQAAIAYAEAGQKDRERRLLDLARRMVTDSTNAEIIERFNAAEMERK